MATPFDNVDQRCEALLSEYTTPEQQGRILFSWTHIEGQSGTQHPLKEIDLAKRALDLPQTAERRLWLFMYWGCSLEVSHRGAKGNELAVARRQAVVPHLQGLVECLGSIAAVESEPEPPKPSESVEHYGLGSPGGQYLYAKQQRERKLDDLKRWREMFENQIAHLYALQPLATTEIEILAAAMVSDKDAREQLLLKVQSEVEKRKADAERAKQKAETKEGQPAPAKTIVGAVVDESGKPVADAQVWMGTIWLDRDVPTAAHARTSGEGRFTLELPGGKHMWTTVWALAPGHGLSVGDAREALAVENGGPEVRIVLRPQGHTEFVVLPPLEVTFARSPEKPLPKTEAIPKAEKTKTAPKARGASPEERKAITES